MADRYAWRARAGAGLLLALWAAAAVAGDRERGVALYASARVWSPVSYNAAELIAIDPFSLYRVSDAEWDVNVTSINDAMQFDPLKTSTHRINCRDSTVQIAGWRTSAAFIEYRGPEGTGPAGGPRTPIPAGSMISVARDYACGVRAEGVSYGWLISWLREGVRSPIDQMWLRENSVVVDRHDPGLRSARLMFNQQPVGGMEFRDVYLRCDKRQWMETANGTVTVDWRAPPMGSPREIAFEKICAATPGPIRQSRGAVRPPHSAAAALEGPPDGAAGIERDLQAAKTKCADLGFRPSTTKFADCVLQLSR